MKCIKTNPSFASQQCSNEPFIQNELDKREVLCRYHTMDKVVRTAHTNKQTVKQAVADLNIS